MNPDTRSPGGDLPDQPQAGGSATPPQSPADRRAQQDAAASVLRQKIDALYGDRPVAIAAPQRDTSLHSQPQHQAQPAPVAQPVQPVQAVQQQSIETENPYARTHNPHPLPDADQWKAYHSAWQQYYQKYYEQYYAQRQPKEEPKSYYSEKKTEKPLAAQEERIEELKKDQAVYELRQTLLGKVQKSATKIRKSRHFIPLVAASIVVLLFVIAQYNRVFIANVEAYISPGNVDPQNIVIDPAADVAVGPDPRLIIPKINVDVPVMYDVGTDNASQMAAMEKGVAHFPIPGANSHPGELGNTVLAGHSSNDLFDPGDYKFIFAQLEKLAVGDTIYANYKGKRYTYVITKTEVVKPTEVNKLIYPTTKPVMTLITCTPLGTALNRLLVTAEQVSPDPGAAAEAPAGSGEAEESAAIPGNSPTLLERLFGGQ